MKVHKSIEKMLDDFLRLPRQSQLLFFEQMSQDSVYDDYNPFVYYEISGAFDTSGCQSPIEQMLCVALNVRMANEPFWLLTQKTIMAKSQKIYHCDFSICATIKDDEVYDIVLVECDGHEFHQKTKAQVKRDNERDLDLKMAGYDVLHFSGSQIYNDPYKCADDVIKYCRQKMRLEDE